MATSDASGAGITPSGAGFSMNAPAVAAPPARPLELPALREDLDIHPGPRRLDGAPSWVVYDPAANTFYSIGRVEAALLAHWHLADPEAVLQAAARTVGEPIEIGAIDAFGRFLEQHELLRPLGAAAMRRLSERIRLARRGVATRLLHGYLFFRIPLLHPDRFLERSIGWISIFYTRTFAWLLALAGVLGLYLTARQWSEFVSTFEYFFTFEGLAYYALALLFVKIVHELGHAYTAKRYGLRVPTMGIAFLVMWPVLYTDTTEAWRLTSRRQRLAIGAAGVVAELALALLATLAWSFLDDGPARSAVFFVAAVSWIVSVAINVNPFMRWDGYYLLSDLLKVENLQERGFALARWALREWLFGFGHPAPERFTPGVHRVLLLYAYSTWLYRLVLFIGIALVVYHFFFKAAGVVLMVVELSWFVWRPMVRELRVWYALRSSLALHWRTMRTVLLLALAAALLVFPWQSRIDGAAVLRAEPHAWIHAPVAARLERLLVGHGDRVVKGELLATLRAPRLEFSLAQARLEVRTLERQLERERTSDDLLARRTVLHERLAEALVARDAYAAELARLDVHAPFAGRVTDIPRAVHEGRWIGAEQRLAKLVGESGVRITAFFDEHDRARLGGAANARFYPEQAHRAALEVRLLEADPLNAKVLDEPYLASIHGGSVAATVDERGRTVPRAAVYRLRFEPIAAITAPQQVIRGRLWVEVEGRSLVQRAWTSVVAVLVRESGF